MLSYYLISQQDLSLLSLSNRLVDGSQAISEFNSNRSLENELAYGIDKDLISLAPLALAFVILIAHILLLSIKYRPKWTQPFIKELPVQRGEAFQVRQDWISSHTALLFLLSLAGFFLDVFGRWISVQYLRPLIPALTWVVAIVLIIVIRSKTAPVSLFALFIVMAAARLTVLMDARPPLNHVESMDIGQTIVIVGAIIAILRMPLRDPTLPKDQISSAYASPTYELRSPEDSLTLWQFLSVTWMTPLISLGYKRQLNDEDIWLLGHEFQHRYLHEAFKLVRGSVVVKLIKANAIDLILQCIFGVVEVAANLGSPLLLQQLLKAIENPKDSENLAIKFAILMLLVRLVSSQVGVLNLWFGRRCYERSRGEMITMLYAKTLARKVVGTSSDNSHSNQINENKLTKPGWIRGIVGPFRSFFFSARKSRSSKASEDNVQHSASMGKILNLMRNDVYDVAQRFWEFQTLVTKPLTLVFSIVLLWRLTGWSCMLGIAVILLCQGINIFLMKSLLKWERLRRKATDIKLQKITNFVEAIRHLRWYGWEESWRNEIMQARQRELNLRLITRGWNILIGFVNDLASVMFPVVVFSAYTFLAGRSLRIDIAFPALQLFGLAETSLREVSGLITVMLNARVAAGRIEAFMKEPNWDDNRAGVKVDVSNGKGGQQNPDTQGSSDQTDELLEVPDERSKFSPSPQDHQLELKSASFAFPGSTQLVLHNINLSFPIGLTVVYGEVGAGKSALLQALLGELDQTTGEIGQNNDMIGYCAQTPWLQSMSIRDNILFSSPYEESRYREVLKSCSLLTDMHNFKHGDLSNIGENGVGLSGGQRARVALARAVYSKASILLLDDPISALDHQTAESIVNNCLTGKLMKDRTVVLVTHRVELCQSVATKLVEVSNGTTRVVDAEKASFNDYTKSRPDDFQSQDIEDNLLTSSAAKFIEDEHRQHGEVKVAIYWQYIKAGKLKWWFVVSILMALYRAVDIGSTWLLKQWGERYTSDLDARIRDIFDTFPAPDVRIQPWLLSYFLISLAKSVIFLLGSSCLIYIVYCTGRQMFKDVMIRVSHTTFRFYDITPVGRLMNRLTSDINTIDGNISIQIQRAVMVAITWVSSMIVIASVTPLFLAFALILTLCFVIIFQRFLPTSQSLRRLEMVSLSPLMSNFGALLNGLVTVRAFRAQERFQDRVINVTDAFQKMDHFYWSLQAWLMYRFDILSAFSIFSLTLLAVYTNLSSGMTAFAMIAAANVVTATHSLCKAYGQLQMDFVSVERVVELLHLEQERPASVVPPAWWPTLSGDIIFDDVTIRYAPQLDPSLSGLSFKIKAGSSTAIIGRTGSGKTTVAMALLATIQPEAGRILIDNADLAKVDTTILRKRITFVAQDPILFPGSMRQNLDPLDEYTDYECESVLSKTCKRHGWTLDTQIEAGGHNLSQGQRQLIGLARTLLRRSAIVILDEATASIDSVTAQSIQQVLHEELKDRTVITIAHRLEAVKNADYCIVLGQGRVVKEGRASDLLREGEANLTPLAS